MMFKRYLHHVMELPTSSIYGIPSFFFFFEISIDYPEEVTNCTKTWGLQNSRTKRWIDVVSSITWVIRGCGGG